MELQSSWRFPNNGLRAYTVTPMLPEKQGKKISQDSHCKTTVCVRKLLGGAVPSLDIVLFFVQHGGSSRMRYELVEKTSQGEGQWS